MENAIPAIKGSMRGVRVMRVPRAFAARVRSSSLDGSASDLAKVRCSCGRKGFKNVGIFSSRLFKVSRIAAARSTLAEYITVGEIVVTFDVHGTLRNNSNQWSGYLGHERLQ